MPGSVLGVGNIAIDQTGKHQPKHLFWNRDLDKRGSSLHLLPPFARRAQLGKSLGVEVRKGF